MKKLLSEILSSFKYNEIKNENPDIEVTSLVFDSRECREGSLFFALPGTHTTGNVFIPKAINNGAVAVVYEGDVDFDILSDTVGNEKFVKTAFIKVDSARYAMAPVSAFFFDDPSSKLAVIGVTGTEGKSSTVSFIWQLLMLSGKKAGFISTVEYSLGDEAIPNPEHQTTPEAPLIQEKLYEMVNNGCEYAVVESSSHGLSPKLNRTGCLKFDVGVFMNVTQEHLEFHGTYEQYRDDKANLFRKLDEHNHEKRISGKIRKIPSFGIVNVEDSAADFFTKATKQQVLGFTTLGEAGKGIAGSPRVSGYIPYIYGHNIENRADGLSFDIDNCECAVPLHVNCSLPGSFNVYNLMAAFLVVSRISDTPMEDLVLLADKLKSVKGRMTVVDEGQDFEVIVDYAHTPSSFETIFPPIRKRCKGKMICVFGSGGERDTVKRPVQGEIAGRFCDIVILADEDPRGEDPIELLQQIAVGCVKAGKILNDNLFIIHERPKAIRAAFKAASAGDVVLLLGKAHENSIIYKNEKMEYDEIEEAKRALREMI